MNEYRKLLNCIQSNYTYDGSAQQVKADYDEYDSSRKKATQLAEQYRLAYNEVVEKINNQVPEELTAFQVENAKSEADSVYTSMVSLQSAFLADIRSQTLLLENQLVTLSSQMKLVQDESFTDEVMKNSVETEYQNISAMLNEYNELKNAVEQGYDFYSENEIIQNIYTQYILNYNTFQNEYDEKELLYEDLYNKYSEQSKNITQQDIDNALNTYENALLDIDSVKSNYISKIQSTITQVEAEIQSLESNKSSLEISIKGAENLAEYERLSGEKLKNEAIITINSEIDTLNQNIDSIKAQIAEVDETIKNSEIKASLNGVITLVNEKNIGDIIQAGDSLCTLLPNNEELKVILYVPENQVSKLKIGQKTEYIFDAIPYNEYGKITGRIQSVSADSIVNENDGTKYYLAHADLSAYSLQSNNGSVREVKTGMLVESKIITGSKKAMVWFLEKINLID